MSCDAWVRSPCTFRLVLMAQLAVAWALPALAAERPVLSPATGTLLEHAVQRVPGLQLADGKIEAHAARLRLCAADGPCADVTLHHPMEPCSGAVVRDWCLEGAAGRPWQQGFLDSLAAMAPSPWQVPPARQPPPPARRAPPAHDSPWLLASMLALTPAALALAWSLATRRWRRAAVTAGVLIPVLAVAATPLCGSLGVWDRAALVASWWAGLLLAAVPDWRRKVLLLGATGVGMAVLELGVRLFLPAPPAMLPAAEVQLQPRPEDLRSATLLDPPGLCDALYAAPPAPRHVSLLHLGDSMAAGVGVAPSARFDQQLGLGRDGGQANFAVAGASLDVEYLTAVRVLPKVQAQTVLLHVFEANDLSEFGNHFSCCAGQPILRFGPDGVPQPTCPQRQPARARFAALFAPAPYPLRVLASASRGAAYLVTGWLAATRWLADVHTLPEEEAIRQYRQTLQALRDRVVAAGGRLLVVAMPRPPGMPPPHESASLLAAARALDLPTLDTSDAFAQEERGQPRLRIADRVHLSAQGHALYARLLEPWLRAHGVR